MKRQAETGSPAALPMGGKKPFALAGEGTVQVPHSATPLDGAFPVIDRHDVLFDLSSKL
jgi:hypothetical protein